MSLAKRNRWCRYALVLRHSLPGETAASMPAESWEPAPFTQASHSVRRWCYSCIPVVTELPRTCLNMICELLEDNNRGRGTDVLCPSSTRPKSSNLWKRSSGEISRVISAATTMVSEKAVTSPGAHYTSPVYQSQPITNPLHARQGGVALAVPT